MILWIVVIAMTAAALAFLLVPMLRRAAPPADRTGYDMEIYRDLLVGIDRDLERGLVDDDQAAASRAEIGRRMLATDSSGGDGGGAPATRAPLWMTVAIAVAVPVAAVLIYLELGAPALTGPAATETRAQLAAGEDNRSTVKLINDLARRMESRPDDFRGWLLLGRSLVALNRHAEAADALGRAAALRPGDADILASHGEALTMANDGIVTPRAQQSLNAAHAIAPRDPKVAFYLGMADFQAGRKAAALERWIALEAGSPPDAPWLPALKVRIERLAEDVGADLTALRETALKGAAHREAADAAAKSATRDGDGGAAEQRQTMIRSMVDRLARRLEGQPDDVEGWLRLGRSYRVLGDPEKSRRAFARAAQLRPDNVAVLTAYAASVLRVTEAAATPEFGATIDKILTLEPGNRNALWLAGLAARRSGDNAGARRHWNELLTLVDPGSPKAVELKQLIGALGEAR